MTIATRAFSLDCAGPLSLEGSICGFTLPPVGLGKKAVRFDESGISLSGGVELQDGVVQFVLLQ
jgi:hypothetical protein